RQQDVRDRTQTGRGDEAPDDEGDGQDAGDAEHPSVQAHALEVAVLCGRILETVDQLGSRLLRIAHSRMAVPLAPDATASPRAAGTPVVSCARVAVDWPRPTQHHARGADATASPRAAGAPLVSCARVSVDGQRPSQPHSLGAVTASARVPRHSAWRARPLGWDRPERTGTPQAGVHAATTPPRGTERPWAR